MVLSMENTTGSGLENIELEHSTQGRRSTNVEQDHKQVEEEGGEMKRMGCATVIFGSFTSHMQYINGRIGIVVSRNATQHEIMENDSSNKILVQLNLLVLQLNMREKRVSERERAK